jgi:hypothetical protein
MCENTGENAEKCFPQERICKPGVGGSSPLVSTRANFRPKQVLLLPAGSSAYAVRLSIMSASNEKHAQL